MAASARKLDKKEIAFAPYMTSTAVPKRMPRQLPEERLHPERRPAVRQRTQPRQRPAISVFNLVATLAAAFLVVLVITGYVQLFEATSEVADLTDELEAVQATQATLLSQYESKIDLNYVEEVATTELGMMQPAANQVVYLDLCEPDHAEILTVEEQQQRTTIFTALWDSIRGVIGYFRAYSS